MVNSQYFLNFAIQSQMLSEIEKDFTRFGTRICQELEPLAEECETRPPTLQTLDPWGKRIDSVGNYINKL